MCQLSVSPSLFFRVKAKTPLPCLIAALRSSSLDLNDSLMTSKAAEEGNLSVIRPVRTRQRTGTVCDIRALNYDATDRFLETCCRYGKYALLQVVWRTIANSFTFGKYNQRSNKKKRVKNGTLVAYLKMGFMTIGACM